MLAYCYSLVLLPAVPRIAPKMRPQMQASNRMDQIMSQYLHVECCTDSSLDVKFNTTLPATTGLFELACKRQLHSKVCRGANETAHKLNCCSAGVSLDNSLLLSMI
jgi:hypothetical protein